MENDPTRFWGPSLKKQRCPAFLRLHDFAVSSRNARPESLWSSLSLAPWCPKGKWCTSEPLRWHRSKMANFQFLDSDVICISQLLYGWWCKVSPNCPSHIVTGHIFSFFSCEWTCFPTKLYYLSIVKLYRRRARFRKLTGFRVSSMINTKCYPKWIKKLMVHDF